jgi:hypothetical protein
LLSPLQAQKPGVHKATPAEIKKEEKKKAEPTEPVPLYQGTSIGVEIAGLGSYLLGSDILNTEIAVQANLKNRFLPVIEVGYGKADAINDGNNLHYKTSAPYFRIGMDYNVFYKKTHLPGYLYVGLRYGMSSFSYDVDGPSMTDPNYGGEISYPFAYSGMKSSASWLEGVFGLKVKIYKGFCMGWSVRYKMRMSVEGHDNSIPWYVPGFGKNAGSSFNLTYNLIYNLPF